MKRCVVALLIALFMMSGVNLLSVTTAWGRTPIAVEIERLDASGKWSNEYLNQSVIDMVYLSQQGTVTTYTYMGIDETLTVNAFSVLPQIPLEAHDKLTRFIFEMTNRYRPGTDLALSGTGSLPTVRTWTYGEMKNEAMWAIVYGLKDCLNNLPYQWQSGNSSDSSDSISYIDKYSPENITTTLKAIFNIGNITYSIGEETLTMDVAPEIKDDRTFVPVRFLAYALSVPEEGVQWNGETQTVTITKDETAIELKIGSTVETVNGEPIKMDVAPYIKETGTGGRTMLPARWIAEPLGATVTWDETTQQVKIEMVQEQG